MALKAQQSFIEVDNASVMREIEEVNSITGPDGKAKLIDVTHLRSTGKEYLQGLADFGQISLDMNFRSSNTQQMFLRTMYATQSDPRQFRIRIPDGASFHVFTFLGIVTSWNLDLKTDDKASLKATLQVTGTVTYASPSESP